jgi:hypothetical protein
MTHFNAYVLIPSDVKDVEERVRELMAPYDANLESLPYPRECECVYHTAIKKLQTGQYAMSGRVNGPMVEFTKATFENIGPEFIHKLELLRLGTPDPACADCGGSGISTTTHNCRTEWDHWDMGVNVTAGALADCIDSNFGIPSAQWIVPVKALNLERVPSPRTVVTPDGAWHTYRKFLWFCNALIVDENWEETVKSLLEAHADATLVVVDYHMG